VIKNETEKILKLNTVHVITVVKARLEQSQNLSESTLKIRLAGTRGNSHIGHCAHTSERTSVQVQNV
jgi:hypothetical protein